VAALCVTPPIAAMMLAVAALLGVVEWQALNLFNVVLLSIPPILTSQGVRELLTRLRLQLLLRLPAVLGPPATARELASLITDRV